MKYLNKLNINFNNWDNLQYFNAWYICIYNYTECSVMKIKLYDNNNEVLIKQNYNGYIYEYKYKNIFFDNKFKNIICYKDNDNIIDFYYLIKNTKLDNNKLLDDILDKYDNCLTYYNIKDINFNKRVKNLTLNLLNVSTF